MDNQIAKLYQTTKTILTNKDLSMIWGDNDKNNLNSKIAYYVKQKNLIRLSRGIFAKNKDYEPKELATSIYIPSYISFETVLREAGVIFQHYETIFVVSKWPKTMKVDKYTFAFRKLKDSVLFNATGIIHKDNYSIATVERAFLDTIYLFPDFYFDNLKQIDWEKCLEIAKIYNNKQLIKRLIKYRKNHA
jgi:predicted transcriptional regulator of viral defense system